MFLFFNFVYRMCFRKPSVDRFIVRSDDSVFVNWTLPNSLPGHRPFVGDVYGGGSAFLAERSPFAGHVGGWREGRQLMQVTVGQRIREFDPGFSSCALVRWREGATDVTVGKMLDLLVKFILSAIGH